MDIKEYLNEKLKNNKVADKAKRIIATGLVAGTILTGAGLTACEQKPNMSNEELVSGIVEILENQNEDLELSNIIFCSFDNVYMMIVSNSNMSEYVGYEISKSQFNKLLKLASEKNSEYIELSPNGDAFVITDGGFNDENFKEFNEIIYSTISKGKTIDVDKYLQRGDNTYPTDNDRDYTKEMELYINLAANLDVIGFDNFSADYVLVCPQQEFPKEEGDTIVGGNPSDRIEIIDVYSKNGNSEPDSKRVITYIPLKGLELSNILPFLESNIDNERIKKINNTYLIDFSTFKDKKMAFLSDYFLNIVSGCGAIDPEFCYEAPLQEGEFAQEESEQER